MDAKDIKTLLNAVAEAEVSELILETGDYKLTVKRGSEPQYVSVPAPQPAAPVAVPAAAPQTVASPAQDAQPNLPSSVEAAPAVPAEPASNFTDVPAPIVGTFYAAPAPDADDFVRVGDRVEAGTVLCIIEAMKLMNEIEAETAGVIKEILVSNEEPVEYGQVLFRIDPG